MTPDETSRDLDHLESEVAQLKSALAGMGGQAIPQPTRLPLIKMWAAGTGLNPLRKSFHLPGEHDQCDHSTTGECSAEKPAGPRADLFKAEREFVKKPIEHAIAFDSNGKELFREKGGESSVIIGRQLIDKLKKDGNAVYSHNHPRGSGSFSSQDLTLASVTNLKEMRAVTETPFGKFTFIATRPKGGWPKMDRINSTYARYKDKILLAIGNRYDPGVKENKMQLNVAASHAMMKVVTDKLKIPYKMIRVRPGK